jgi:hypothetical protein
MAYPKCLLVLLLVLPAWGQNHQLQASTTLSHCYITVGYNSYLHPSVWGRTVEGVSIQTTPITIPTLIATRRSTDAGRMTVLRMPGLSTLRHARCASMGSI